MKNNLIKIFLNFLATCILFTSFVFSQEITFEAKNVENIDDNFIKASDDIVISDNLGVLIYGENLLINRKKKIYDITDNVIYVDKNNLFEIKSNKIQFNQLENKITTFGDTVIYYDKKYQLKGKDIIFNRNKEEIFSSKESELTDNLKNYIKINGFNISLKDNLLIADKAKLIDPESNIYELEKIYYDFEKQNILGKDIVVNNDNKLSKKNYLPRVKGKSYIYKDGSSTLKKIVATTCKKKEGCPPWSIKAEEINHNKKNKTINYKNATLRLYDFPVLYFPKFFHPDPTVDRQSGFLTPTISSQNLSSYLTTPYFFAISDHADFTFSPRFYDNKKNLYQGEYRHVTKNSNSIIDASIKNDGVLANKSGSSETHFFLESTSNSNFDLFDISKFNIQLQSVSNNNYLKKYNLKSPIIDSDNALHSYLNFEGYTNDMEFNISSEIYENLNKEINSDKYEIISPNFSLSKNLQTKLDGSLSMTSIGYNKLFETNIHEKALINNLNYKSLDSISNLGLINNYEIFVKNFNANSKNSKTFKNKTEHNLQGLIQFNSKLPMKKEGENYFSTLTPILSAKFNPYPNKDLRENSRIIDYSNIFSLDRLSANETVEGGESITIGNEYKIFNNNNSNDEVFGLSLATSFRRDENEDLPSNSYLGQTTSNIVGQMNLKTNEFIEFGYDFASDNNLGQMNYHKIDTTFKINNFITSFKFIEENHAIGNESFVSNETSYSFNANNNIKFETRKNKKTNLTEYYNLLYQYKIDCLVAGIEYNKKYYSEGGLKPEESVFFSITLMPFDTKTNLPGIGK